MKHILSLLVILLVAFGCGQNQDRLRNGDLIFVGRTSGEAETGSMDEAISSATGEKGAPLAGAMPNTDGPMLYTPEPLRSVL